MKLSIALNVLLLAGLGFMTFQYCHQQHRAINLGCATYDKEGWFQWTDWKSEQLAVKVK